MMPLIWLCTLNVSHITLVVRVQEMICTHSHEVLKVLNRVLNVKLS